MFSVKDMKSASVPAWDIQWLPPFLVKKCSVANSLHSPLHFFYTAFSAHLRNTLGYPLSYLTHLAPVRRKPLKVSWKGGIIGSLSPCTMSVPEGHILQYGSLMSPPRMLPVIWDSVNVYSITKLGSMDQSTSLWLLTYSRSPSKTFVPIYNAICYA